MSMQRVMVLSIPDWPIHAHRAEAADTGEDPNRPIALVARHLVVACSPAARAEGVRIGLREREAMQRCPSIAVHPHSPEADRRRFAPVFAALTRIVPQIEQLRPGLVAMGVRGPARYYGGEAAAAEALLGLVRGEGFPESRIGIADGRFAAEQAAQPSAAGVSIASTSGSHAPAANLLPGVVIVEPGRSSAFLNPLPVSRAVEGEFAALLAGLGIRTLGAFAALPENAVRNRFGPAGVAAHRRASGVGETHGEELHPHRAERDLAVRLDLEPPLDSADRLAFACSDLAERFDAHLSDERLVCTDLRIILTDDLGTRYEREWSHPRRFSPADIVSRIRWQAEATAGDDTGTGGGRTAAGIVAVRIEPVRTDRAAAHEPGLWNTGPDERVHHHLSRAQSLLGHTGVTTATLGGGRLLRDRQRFTPWGTAPRHGAEPGPWPGSLPAPQPSLVYDPPLPADLLDGNGSTIEIDADDLLTAEPVALRVEDRALPEAVRGWSQPWPIRERWWEGRSETFRVQVELANGDAWLMLRGSGCWFAEGRYD